VPPFSLSLLVAHLRALRDIHEAPHHVAVLKNPPAYGALRLRCLKSSRIEFLIWGLAYGVVRKRSACSMLNAIKRITLVCVNTYIRKKCEGMPPNTRSADDYASGAVRWRSARRLALAVDSPEGPSLVHQICGSGKSFFLRRRGSRPNRNSPFPRPKMSSPTNLWVSDRCPSNAHRKKVCSSVPLRGPRGL
jgi:hypothetical protein